MERLPQSLEAEMALLGSILTDRDAYARVRGDVASGDFHLEANRVIFAELEQMAHHGFPLDVVTLSCHLEERGLLGAAGGRVYLDDLIGAVPFSGNAPTYARIVRDRARDRDLLGAVREVGRCLIEGGNLSAALARLREVLGARKR